MQPYSPAIEAQMRSFYQSLSERDRRRYAALEASKLGRGGLSYIASLLECNRHTIAQGQKELDNPQAMQQTAIRRPGGGRKSSLEIIPDLDAAFLQVLEHHTAGSPVKADIKWTNLTQKEIALGLKELGIEVSVTVVQQLLDKHQFVRRKAQKYKSTGLSPHRDEQFIKIAQLRAQYGASPNPVISMDTKKKS